MKRILKFLGSRTPLSSISPREWKRIGVQNTGLNYLFVPLSSPPLSSCQCSQLDAPVKSVAVPLFLPETKGFDRSRNS